MPRSKVVERMLDAIWSYIQECNVKTEDPESPKEERERWKKYALGAYQAYLAASAAAKRSK